MVHGLPLQMQWIMQDGTTPHTATVVLDFSNTALWPSRHVKQLCGSSQLRQRLATSSPWAESSRLLFVGLPEGEAFPTKTIQWTWDERNAFWVMQRYSGRHVSPCYYEHVSSTSISYSKKWWPHRAHTDTKTFTQMLEKNVWSLWLISSIRIFYSKFPFVDYSCITL